MAAANETGSVDGAARVERAQLAAARRRAGLPDDATGEPWLACRAPAEQLVLAADGGLRACDHACVPLGREAGGAAATFRTGAGAGLRGELAQGRLPLPHCAGCATWFADELFAAAPPLRDHGGRATAAAAGPRELVLQLPPPDQELDPGVLRDLDELLAGLELLVIEGGDPFAHPALPKVLARARQRSDLAVAVRLRRLTDAGVAAAALRGLAVRTIELTLAAQDQALLAAGGQLAATTSATLRARMVLGPENWHWFEDAARAAAERAVPLDLVVLDRGGAVPLAALAVDDLRLVKDVVASAWDRCGGEHRPASLAAGALERLVEELRALMVRRAADATPGTTSLRLPAFDHPWLADATRRAWWLQHLFGHGHLAAVADWLATVVVRDDTAALLRSHAWLRVLAHRIAAERREPRLLEALRTVYRDARTRARIIDADAAFAAELDLKPYGGPWAERLGLLAQKQRKRPFALGKARLPRSDAGTPDLTVLVPSYRHGEYIDETLRSVLAQRFADFRLLVVDDCSPDDTAARARAIADPRLVVRVNDRNLGLGNTVLQALATIDTPYVALLNSDDLFHPDRLGRCRDVLVADPTAQLVTTGLSLVDAAGGELTPGNASLVLDGQQVFDWVHWYEAARPAAELPPAGLFGALLERNFLATSSNLVARTDWLRAQAASLRSLKFCLDWQLFLEAARTGGLRHLPAPLVAYRLHATNSVWFREGRRWSYYLEVNRVAAAAVRAFAEAAGGDDARVEGVLDAIANHVARNRETDGLALFVHGVLDALQVDRLAAAAPRVQQLVQQLNTAAEQVRADRDRSAARAADDRIARRLLQGELAAEQAAVERDTRRWLQGYVDTLEQRLRDVWAGRHDLERDKATLLEQQQRYERRIADLDAAARNHEQQHAALAQRLHELQGDLEAARGAAAAVQQLRAIVDVELAATRADRDVLRQERDTLRDERDRVQQEREAVRAERDAVRHERDTVRHERDVVRHERDVVRHERDAVRAERDTVRHERDAVRAERDALQRHHDQVLQERDSLAATAARLTQDLLHERDAVAASAAATADLQRQLDAARAHQDAQRQEQARQAAELAALAAARQQLEQAQERAARELQQRRQETELLLRSREFRWGDRLWNRTPLAYLSRRGKKWYRKLLGLRDRWLRPRQPPSPGRAQGVAVVTACWQWPIYSHTFVYQEMLGLTHMGLDVLLFHWELGDTSQLHRAFEYLAEHRLQLQPVWEEHLRDRDHFERTRPGRLRSFLDRVAAATGRSADELANEPLVLQGCTFARRAELAGARYLHSYFFYDQSFMAMQAAWLLGLPRGVSCYADHMLDDYAFKLVPLHVELADVVVATSARIKRELSQKSGGRFDDKIVVKPNGVDGARFAPIARPERRAGDPFEVVSISRIEPKKGLIHLVEAVAELKQRGHRVVAHVIGSKDPHSKGSLEFADAFERRIAELGMQQEIVLHGMKRQEELPPILQRCRAFVAPYVEISSGDKDGIPTAMLEALASNLPVVTTDSGSILEVVDDGVEGLVVPQRDSGAFAAALARLITDPALERRMAKAARARFERDFDIRVTERRLHQRVAALLAALPASR